MNIVTWFHGSPGDNILQIIHDGKMCPKDGKIYFSSTGREGCFAQGIDTKRKACFAFKAKVQIPLECSIEQESTNVPGTRVVHTAECLNVQLLEMYIRPKPFDPVQTIKGENAIKAISSLPLAVNPDFAVGINPS